MGAYKEAGAKVIAFSAMRRHVIPGQVPAVACCSILQRAAGRPENKNFVEKPGDDACLEI